MITRNLSLRLLCSCTRHVNLSKYLYSTMSLERAKPCDVNLCSDSEKTPTAIASDKRSTDDGRKAQEKPTGKSAKPEASIKRRTRPPLSYTDDFQTPQSVVLNPIGVVRSPYKVCHSKMPILLRQRIIRDFQIFKRLTPTQWMRFAGTIWNTTTTTGDRKHVR